MYQTQRQILWGFTSALISNDLLMQYSWSRRSGQSKKYSFQDLKHVQGVLWCSMVKISPKYAVKTFEDDFKSIIAKCSRVKKTEGTIEMTIDGDDNDEDVNNDNRSENDKIPLIETKNDE